MVIGRGFKRIIEECRRTLGESIRDEEYAVVFRNRSVWNGLWY